MQDLKEIVRPFYTDILNAENQSLIMTIDIHTVRDNQITKVYHLEEWTAAFGQLQS